MRDRFAMRIFDVDLRPVFFIFEHDRRLDHVHRRGISCSFGPADLSENVMDFGETLNDLIGLLQNLPCFGGRNSRERRRHVEQIAFVKRRHELGAEVLVRKQFANRD